MQDDNSRDMDTAVTDKKGRVIGIAYKAVCVAVAVLGVLTLVLMFAGTNAVLSYASATWLSTILMSLMPAMILALIVVALLNLKKERPRLLTLFGGAVAFYGGYMVAVGWTLGLLMAVAGLAALVVVGMRQGYIHQDAPVVKTKGKMLVISGMLSILVALVEAGYAVLIAVLIASYYGYPQLSTVYFFIGLLYVAGSLGLMATCFMKNRKTSVFYRMFFLGAFLVMVAEMTNNVVFTIQMMGLSGFSYIYFGANALVLIILVLVLLHAIRTRPKKGAAEAEAELEETAEEAEDEEELDETIGLYKEEDEIDETIGLYKEEDEAEKPTEDESPKDDEK